MSHPNTTQAWNYTQATKARASIALVLASIALVLASIALVLALVPSFESFP